MTLMPQIELLKHKAAKHQTTTHLEREAEKLLREKRSGQLAKLWQVLVGRIYRHQPAKTNAVPALK